MLSKEAKLKELFEKLDESTDEYYDFYITGSLESLVCLDGTFGIEELEIIVKILKLYSNKD